MSNKHLLTAFVLLIASAGAAAQIVTIGGKAYTAERVGGVEDPGAFNDPGDFTQPTYLTQAPNDDNTLYIIERTDPDGDTGKIVRFDPLTNTRATYLDLTGSFVSDGGLATMAFHPDFANNGLFYVTANYDSGSGIKNRLMEFHDSGVGSPTLTRTLLEYNPLVNNFHTINWVGFQPGDATHKLYVTTGDGGTQASQPQFDPALVESPDSLYGKILRFDLTADFSTPASDTTHAGIEVVSLGHRNPYRASFDAAGNLFFGEVGFNAVEEINFLSAAQIASPEIEDFGWTDREGSIETVNGKTGVGGPKGPNDIDPIFDYLHPGINPATVGYTGQTAVTGQSVTCGYLFDGRLFFADFVTGRVYSGAWDGAALTDVTDHDADLDAALNDGIQFITSFATDNAGNLYIIDFGDGFFSSPGTGEIFKLSPFVDNYVLTYNAANGEMTIDTDGGPLNGYVIQGNGFLEENHTRIFNQTLTAEDTELSESDLLGTPASGNLSLGYVLPDHLSEPAVVALLGAMQYTTTPGSPVFDMQFRYLPAPGDTDLDGDIDDFDLINAIVNYTGSLAPGTGGKTPADGDTDNDGDVDDFDLITMIVSYTGSLEPPRVSEQGPREPFAVGKLTLHTP